MNKDRTYCPGTSCPIKRNCARYIDASSRASSLKQPAWWVEPAYDAHTIDCPHLILC